MNTTKQQELNKEQELNKVIDAANTLIDFIMDNNLRNHVAFLDSLNEARSEALSQLENLTGATY